MTGELSETPNKPNDEGELNGSVEKSEWAVLLWIIVIKSVCSHKEGITFEWMNRIASLWIKQYSNLTLLVISCWFT